MTRKQEDTLDTGTTEASSPGLDRASLRAVAMAALVRVASDATAPAAAQAQAARSLLEVAGVLGPRAVSDAEIKPVSEMTAAEIDAELRALGG